jgi:predicted ester cyclase
MEAKFPHFNSTPRTTSRHPQSWSRVGRWAGLWACLLSLSLIAPATAAGAIPNADDGGGGAGGSGSATSGPHQTVTRLFTEVFTQQQGDVCTELMTAGAEHQTPAGQYRGPEGFTTFADTIWTAFPNAVFVLDQISESADTVAVRWSMTGTHLGPLDGQAATGTWVTLHGLAQFAFEGDRIAASWIAYDRLGLVNQLTGPAVLPPTCAECQETPF